jgi:flagellar basal-body rod protein FlgB
MISSLFSKTIGLLAQALDLRSERHRVITANIANQDTPGYKAMEVNFKEALASAQEYPPLTLQRTDPAHLPPAAINPPSSHAAVSSRPSQRLDGNTVNGEEEMAKLSENTLFYTATTQILNSKFRGIRNTIREGR